MRPRSQSGFSLLEVVLVIVVLAIMATIFVPLASGLVDAERASTETNELLAIYKGIVGDPKSNIYGYLGDVGDYPASLKDLIIPPVPANGWNGPLVWSRSKGTAYLSIVANADSRLPERKDNQEISDLTAYPTPDSRA